LSARTPPKVLFQPGLKSNRSLIAVQARVAGLDPRNEGVHDLDRRQVTPADAERQLRRAHEGQLVRERHAISSSLWVRGRGSMSRFLAAKDDRSQQQPAAKLTHRFDRRPPR
jgi:hypothetical protein